MESPPLKLAFLVLFFSAITCSIALPKPSATVTEINLDDFSLAGISLTFGVSVRNPYGVPIPVTSADYSLKSGNTVVASGTIPDPGSLKPHGDTLVNVQVKVPHDAIVTLMKDVAADADIDYDIEVKLKVHLPVIGHISIPVNKKGQFQLLPWRHQYV